MKIIVLTENTAGGNLLAEHGLSYIIEHKNKRILFDTGHSDVFLKNAKELGVDIPETIVLSHGHWDHGDGLRFLEGQKLIAHPNIFMKRFRKNDNSNIGLQLSKDEIESRFQLTTSDAPYKVTEHIIFLGEIPRTNNFEAKITSFVDEQDIPDFVLDDSALAIVDNQEIIVVSGCAHSGICNIIEYAKEITGISGVKAVIGGFHLKHNNKQTQSTIEYFKEQKIQQVYPSHCTELPALNAFLNSFNFKQVKTGMTIEL